MFKPNYLKTNRQNQNKQTKPTTTKKQKAIKHTPRSIISIDDQEQGTK